MQRATFEGRRRMQPQVSRWGWLDGYRLAFDLPVGAGERGVANLVLDAGARVCGVLYGISAEELERLDRSEGVHRGYYDRLRVEVLADHGRALPALTYVSRHAVHGRKPSPRYMGLILDGAREHGLPADYLEYLESFELAIDERS